MKKLRFALIGCGRISKKHIEAINQIGEAELVAVCDKDRIKAKKIGNMLGISYSSDYHIMIKALKDDIDIISILTDSGSHANICCDIAKYNKHIIVEKPMALTLDDADRMINICDENGIKLFVVKQNRFNPPIQLLYRAIQEGRFGRIFMATARVRWHRTQEYYDSDSWRGTWKSDGGVFANQASHHIDLLEWLVGEVESVFAKADTFLHKIEVEDTGASLLVFRNGALGTFEATTCTNPVDLEGSISILGENGTVEIGGFAVNEIKTWKFKDHKDYDDEVCQSSYKPKNVYGNGHINYIKDVIDSIQNKRKGLVEGLEARKSLELINAIYESIETSEEIYLRFKPKRCRLGR